MHLNYKRGYWLPGARIPGKTTTHSDADDHLFRSMTTSVARVRGEHRWMCLLIAVFALRVNPVLTAFGSHGFAFDGAA